jgi:hypothetical protein
MRTRILAILLSLLFVTPAMGGVFVIANYTTEDLTFTVAEPGEKERKHTLPAFSVLPIPISGPADLKLPIGKKNDAVRVELANAYYIVPDRAFGIRIECAELPGKAPERDARPELNPIPRNPVKIPVTLLVDDADPRSEMLWKADARKRFDEAAAILEKQTGFRFEFAGFDTWKSDAKVKEMTAALDVFEDAVKVKPGALAIGFTSQKIDTSQQEFGACRGMGSSHIIIREWWPKGEPERVEVLVRYLAMSQGAVNSPDPGSAMRAKLGDGLANNGGFVIRLDPLNALVLNLLADQRRQGITKLDAVPQPDRTRLTRVYSALLDAFPGEVQAIDYLNVLDKEVAKADPKNPDGGVKRDPLRVPDQAKRTEAIRIVVLAITDRAKANTGPTALTGDELTTELLLAAAKAAQSLDEPNRVGAFLLGIGLALDDSNTLRTDPLTSSAVADVETNAERKERMAILGNPTLRNRRDLCRRFAVGCGTGELLTQTAAENGAISQARLDLQRASGFSFPSLSAEFAGIAFARILRENPEAVFKQIREKISTSELVPEPKGLRDGIGREKFEEAFGSTNDERFQGALSEIRKRVVGMALNKLQP